MTPKSDTPATAAHRMGEGDAAICERREREFAEASNSISWIGVRLARGEQFNAYECASNDEDDHDDDREYYIGLGPINDFGFVVEITGKAKAEMIAHALTAAAIRAKTGGAE